MMVRAALLRRLARDRSGASALEFGLLAPAMLLVMLGLIDLARVATARSALEAATIQAARQVAATDCPADRPRRLAASISAGMRSLTGEKDAAPEVESRSYADRFGDVGAPEPFVDDPAAPNRVYDPGESFTDVNGNGQWDADMGVDGSIGGAGEVISYTANLRVRPLIPFLVERLTGRDHYPIRASTVVRNEPVFRDLACAP